MAGNSVRKGLLAAGIGVGACALAGVAWFSNHSSAPPAAPVANSTASAAASATASASTGKPGVPRTAGKGGTAKSTDNPLWANLSHPQQEALAPLAAEWNKLSALRKQKWLDIASRFASMKPDEQARVHERMREWIKLTPEQRRMVRENYARAKRIDPGEKTLQWEQYQQLPEEQKKKLAAEPVPKKPANKLLPAHPGVIMAPAAPIINAVAAPMPVSPAAVPASAPAAVTPPADPAATAPVAPPPAMPTPSPTNAK
ncbi:MULTISPECIES: DUF3106 domain-containing protein [unclassified Janthinobacterium]|uniref:DUF3106 domain-containing protein n=1 Tax=unclassified Janthinobacterium TaxID=2610881 RepID=UPI001612FB3C|nr:MULTISPECIES: DUF3106 domain-containing protein [unclassified Janthinobacterium]MBB5367058.1 hypothetical protein [Janthinobacterium sp. K2C7]MBB5380464.1 hypothetical protein [Janthinobacterium sp. K2Li3]MBB5385440.1 hypothetical protein [Janthinobacterium sp. K2E3]